MRVVGIGIRGRRCRWAGLGRSKKMKPIVETEGCRQGYGEESKKPKYQDGHLASRLFAGPLPEFAWGQAAGVSVTAG